ncbi:murein biosynthesis integral membrane protein MurJ [Silvibacterium sp.]|uniref:murein biosynthesis integral membrane protein MurJ n=1 Tax=Silvibacterium sp. TaxID=1964179 RepID=UPI0039E21698
MTVSESNSQSQAGSTSESTAEAKSGEPQTGKAQHQAGKVRSRSSALAVASGIFLSRIVGLVRDRVFAYYFGNSDAADAFRAAFRIPNFLQNLFGEGVLSASFIPVYARLRAEERHEEASQLAESIFAILLLLTSVLVLVGVLTAPWLVDAIAPGFHGAKRALVVRLVQLLFPGAALLVLSAWCLGVLNSHKRFLLSYAAPVIWNFAMIATFFVDRGRHGEAHLAVAIAIGSVIGSALQFAIQIPTVIGLLRPLAFRIRGEGEHTRTVMKNFGPVFVSRGVVQVSAYLDSLLASFLPTGAVAALSYAQTLNSLPVSLFGMAVSAAELPTMAGALGSSDEVAATLQKRLAHGFANISYFVVPSAAAFIALGDVIVALIYRSGHFTGRDVNFVWSVLAGSGAGLLASTAGRLYSSAFYALRDTRTPLNYALVRVSLTVLLGYLFALPLPRLLHIAQWWGVAGLTFSAGIAGWVEFALLRRGLSKRIGPIPSQGARLARLWVGAVLAAAVAYFVKTKLPADRPWLTGLVVLPVFGLGYAGIVRLLGVSAPINLKKVLRIS